MPPGITMRPVASITGVVDCAGSVSGAAIAAMVSPAMAISHWMTPCGVTTSPPRTMRSSITPPLLGEWCQLIALLPGDGSGLRPARSLTQGLIHAVLVLRQARDESARQQAFRQPCEAL